LNGIVSGLVKMLRQVAGERIAVEFVPDPRIETACVDSAQMEQVLVNLTANARDAMPDGGRIVIETRSAHLDEELCKHNPWATQGHYVMLSFSDTGTGIPSELRERIFEPFFSTKEVGKGTGLGLSTVHGIVMQHEGLVHVESKPGHGTSFFIYLPAVPRETGLHAAPSTGARGSLPEKEEKRAGDVEALTISRV